MSTAIDALRVGMCCLDIAFVILAYLVSEFAALYFCNPFFLSSSFSMPIPFAPSPRDCHDRVCDVKTIMSVIAVHLSSSFLLLFTFHFDLTWFLTLTNLTFQQRTNTMNAAMTNTMTNAMNDNYNECSNDREPESCKCEITWEEIAKCEENEALASAVVFCWLVAC